MLSVEQLITGLLMTTNIQIKNAPFKKKNVGYFKRGHFCRARKSQYAVSKRKSTPSGLIR